MTTILDAGALIAIDRNDRSMWVRLKGLHSAGERPVTHGGVVGQVWRGGSRQARLATALSGMDVRPLDESLGRKAGELMALAGMSDVVDAALVALANDGDEIITLDREDLGLLASSAGRDVELIRP
ncbi:MAG TPA: twitching motility protein PilT [Acidimicrobiaceae bacterium]|nr:twitching motility protein PilT [Acidimicrobiaceae bacterium]